MAALAISAAPTLGAEPAGPTASDRETARDLMKRGDAKADVGDFVGALDDYRAADRIMGVPTTRVAVGRALAQMGRLLEARDALLSVRGMPVADHEPQVIGDARGYATSFAQELAERIPTVSFKPRDIADPQSLELAIDGKPVIAGTATVARKIDPGPHRITARVPGHEPLELELELAEREARVVELVFVPVTGPSPAATAAETPPEVPAPTSAPAQPPAASQAGQGEISPVAWVGFGIGAAGLVVGAVAGGIALGRASDLKDQCPEDRCPRSQTEDAYDDTYAAARASTAGFIIGAAGLATGLIGLALPGADPQEPSADASLRVWVGPSGLGVAGRF